MAGTTPVVPIQMTPVPFGALSVLLGNGASPEVFASPCGLTSYNWSVPTSTNEEDLPACNAPDAPAYTSPKITAIGDTLTMQGFADGTDTADQWWAWIHSGLPKNVKFIDTQRNIMRIGPAICTAREEATERRQSTKLNVTVRFIAQPTQTTVS